MKLLPIILGMLWACSASAQCTAPTGLTATAKGPDQINLTWTAASNPCYGYLVEESSNGGSTWTKVQPIPTASGNGSLENTDPSCTYCLNTTLILQTYPTWVVESQYIDPMDGTAAQAIISGLLPNSAYSFRVRTYQSYAGTVYSAYSSTASATTSNYTVRYVNTATGNDANGGTNSTSDAWKTFQKGCSTIGASGVVIVIGGNYAADFCEITHSGTNATARVVVMCNPGDTCTITSTSGGGTPALWLPNNFNVIDGISLTGSDSSTNDIDITGNHDSLFGGNISSQGVTQGSQIANGANNVLLQGVYLHDSGTAAVDNIDCLYILGNSATGPNHNIVQYNHFTRCSHANVDDLNQSATTANTLNQIMNNVVDGGWGNGIEVVLNVGGVAPVNHDLIEGNYIVHVGRNTIYSDFKDATADWGIIDTFRRNIMWDGNNYSQEVNASRGVATGNLHYNNIMYGFGWSCWYIASAGGTYTGLTFENNICTKGSQRSDSNTGAAAGSQEFYLTEDSSMVITHNDTLPYVSGANSPGFANAIYYNGSTGLSVATNDTTYNPPFSSNSALTVDPIYVNESGFDFHLQTTSPLVGAGVSVTDATWGTIGNTNLGAFAGSFTPTAGSTPNAPPKAGLLLSAEAK